jgi:exosortase A-associated hydrolase 1
MTQEIPVSFSCEGQRLIGIANLPSPSADTGVVIIVGGPQYRAGSHRQFTLLARALAAQGYPAFRFDYRGMGDGEGEIRHFERVEEDIHAAIDAFQQLAPNVRRVVLWGLCDAASAALYYGHKDKRVAGMLLLNPWVHTEAGERRARLRHYYLARLMQPEFWLKLLRGKVQVRQSVGELGQAALATGASEDQPTTLANPLHGAPGYVDRMLQGVQAYTGRIHILLSGQDMVAREFEQLIRQNKAWKRAMRSPRIRIEDVKDANHTFSSAVWRRDVEQKSHAFLRELQ